MKKLLAQVKDFFNPSWFNNLDTVAIGEALNDLSVRTIWLNTCFEEIRRINLEVDRRLMSGHSDLIDLCARRQAYQDILESVLSARRQLTKGPQEPRHNPRPEFAVNLDRVTA